MKKNTLLYRFTALFSITLLVGCGYNYNSNPHSWLRQYNLHSSITPDNLTLCVNFGCTETKRSAISDKELQKIRSLFQPLAKTAKQEREQIAQAIALFEQQQGLKIGTHNDLAENDFSLSAGSHQLDCVAETSNTSVYLVLLSDMGLLRFHTVTGNAHRGPFTLNLPHNTAVIQEQSSGKAFAIDSWFGANGELPWVTPVEHWLTGATPSD